MTTKTYTYTIQLSQEAHDALHEIAGAVFGGQATAQQALETLLNETMPHEAKRLRRAAAGANHQRSLRRDKIKHNHHN